MQTPRSASTQKIEIIGRRQSTHSGRL